MARGRGHTFCIPLAVETDGIERIMLFHPIVHSADIDNDVCFVKLVHKFPRHAIPFRIVELFRLLDYGLFGEPPAQYVVKLPIARLEVDAAVEITCIDPPEQVTRLF